MFMVCMAVTTAKQLGRVPDSLYRMGMTQGPTQPEHFGEAELVAAMKRGEDAAYEQFVRQFGPRLLAVAKRILRDENAAQDAFQEAMVSALRNIDSFEGNAKLSTWMHRIVVNAALMRLRKRKRLSEVSIDATLPGV
jgi:RNA polymerase sigma-70 factor (ECF subfamily)